MKLKIEIEFTGPVLLGKNGDPEVEVSRILSVAGMRFADAVGYGEKEFENRLLDINGNTVGSVKLEK